MPKVRVQYPGSRQPCAVWKGHHIMLPAGFSPPVRDGVSGVGQCRNCLALFYAVGSGGQVVIWPTNGRRQPCHIEGDERDEGITD